MGEKSKSRGWCGWFIAFIVLAAVVLAVVYTVKSRMKKSDNDGAGPVPGPPGAIDKKYADALKLALQFFDIQKCKNPSSLFFLSIHHRRVSTLYAISNSRFTK